MFKKLLSNLPFNPSLIGQVSFYAKRVHEEASLRRLGIIMVVLAVLVQCFAVIAPPEATLASDGHDIVSGGFTSQAQAVQLCQGNSDFNTILLHYGITCDNVAAGTVQSLRSDAYNKQLYSLGRKPYGKAGETPVDINGTTFYMRYLWSWDTGAYSTYQVIAVHNIFSVPFFIMFNCGNVVQIGAPTTPPPSLQITKTVLSGYPAADTTVRPGAILGYRLNFTNSGNGPATNLVIEDPIPAGTTPLFQGGFGIDANSFSGTPISGQDDKAVSGLPSGLHNWWIIPTFKARAQGFIDMTVRVNNDTADGQRICNTAYIRSKEVAIKPSAPVCHIVKRFAPPPAITATPTPQPTPVPPATPCADLTCLSRHKTARNDTQRIANANGTMAKPGDQITYTLTIHNSSDTAVSKVIMQEDLYDVLQYAKVVSLSGGTIDKAGQVTWSPVNVPAQGSVQKTIVVRVKDTLPDTPSPASNPGSFDMMMTNVFGDTINIKLPPSITKTTETVTQSLPNTGPGESLTVAVLFTVFVSYFFARSRLFAKELDIVRTDYTTNGGY
jgi:uncharacterized repeat protein (TIGR01451 family)